MGNNQSAPQRIPAEDISEINELALKEPKDLKNYL